MRQRLTLALAVLISAGLVLAGCGGEDTAGVSPVDPEDLGGGEADAQNAAKDAAAEEDFGPTPGPGLVEDGAGDVGPDEGPAAPDTTPMADLTEEPDLGPPPPPPAPCEDLEDGDSCDDNDPCTTDDTCSFGECQGEPHTCSDGLGCTRDECDGEGGCSFPIWGDRCLIEGACYHDGDSGSVPCVACVAPVSQTEWIADDTLGCEDGAFCTAGDFCFGGECVGGSVQPCDDSNWCTDDGCDNLTGCTHAPNTRNCDDGDACTMADFCKNGVCLPGDGALCDDANPCTLDACLFGGCIHQETSGQCDDGSTCTINDTCIGGECLSGAPLSCTDGNPCTDDLCHPKAGCVNKYNAAPCSDGNPCTAGDLCAFGECQTGPLKTLCNDTNPCTADSCNPVTGICDHVPDNGVLCTDGDPCTLGDFCEDGTCKSGGQTVQCDDGNVCTDDGCGADGTCTFTANFLACSDGDPCTEGDTCLAGACQVGSGSLNCSDLNPCTDDWCEPGVGCTHAPNSVICSDGDACTVGDVCINGQCTPGASGAACDDFNPCTDDQCVPDKGCVNVPNAAICSDDEPCTISDQCVGGVCVGDSGDCDDGNECTKEICLAGGGCEHVPINSFECRPIINITYPPRGAMLTGEGPINVTGIVTVGGEGLKDFFINGFPVATDPVTGQFSFPMEPRAGLNIIQAIANSKLGGEDTAVRSYAWSPEYHPLGTKIPSGIGLWLSQAVWDDNNTSDVDDIATVVTLILGQFDLPSLIPNPLAETGALQCNFTVKAQPILIGQPQVDIISQNQALSFKIRYPNMYVGLDVDASGFLCPGVSGSVSASYIEVGLDMIIVSNPDGTVTITTTNENVTIAGLNIDIDGILGFLFNWIINLFEGTIASAAEGVVLQQLADLPSALADALQALAITQDFDLPTLLGDGPPTKLTLSSTLADADFDQFGGFIELSTKMTAGAKNVPYETLGSLARAQCGAEDAEFFDYLMQGELEVAFKDDMINQMLHAAWYAGAFEIPLSASMLGDVDVSEYGVEIFDIQMSFLLPPILSSCNYEELLTLGIGDIEVTVSMNLFGQPLVLTAYASAEIVAEMTIIEGLDGNELGIALGEILVFDTEVGEVSAGFENAQGAVEELIGQFLGPGIFDALGGDALGSIPIPSIPLDGFDSSIPSGTTLGLALSAIYRFGGRTVMGGNAVAGSTESP